MTISATLLFVLTAFFNEKYPLGDDDAQAYKPYLIPTLFWLGCAVSLVFVVSAMSDLERPASADRWVTAGWLGSLLCLIIGMLWVIHWRPPKWRQIRDWFGQNKQELLIVTALLLVGAFLRTYILTQHPYPWSGDEASVGIEGSRILKGEVTDFFAAGWSGQPNWSFVPTALAEIILGKTILAIRVVSVAEGTLAILFLYLLARELFGRTIAALAAGFLVAFPVHIQFSRIGVNNIIDSLTICLVLWLVIRAIRKGRPSDYLWAGIAGGLAFYTYVGSRLVLALAIFVLAYTAIRQRGYLRSHLSHLGIFLAGVVVAIAPQGYYFIRHPDIFMTRIGQESIFLNHWLVNQSQQSGQSIPAILWKQFTDTALVYISQPAVGNFFNSPMPYLTIIGSIFFLFGMGYAFTKLLETRMMILLVWFWSVVIVGGVLTLSPPANTRLVMTTPAVALFLALGIYKFTDYILKLKIFNQRWQTIVNATLLVVLAIQNIGFYFGVYRYRGYFEDASGELGQQIGLELQQLGSNYDFYLFGEPRVFAAFPTTVFLAPDNGYFDLTSDTIDSSTLRPGKGNIFVAIPENRADLGTIALKYPGGTWETVQRGYKQEVLYYAYLMRPK
jgi:4-amino-4-deoxy-L-arabinose transferase-like glycosyltransferase